MRSFLQTLANIAPGFGAFLAITLFFALFNRPTLVTAILGNGAAEAASSSAAARVVYFLAALKVLEGGWVPLALGGFVMLLMHRNASGGASPEAVEAEAVFGNAVKSCAGHEAAGTPHPGPCTRRPS
jgi:hypothetical protein